MSALLREEEVTCEGAALADEAVDATTMRVYQVAGMTKEGGRATM